MCASLRVHTVHCNQPTTTVRIWLYPALLPVLYINILDVELIPGLGKACRRDISKFCHKITNNDQVIPCLKKNIKVWYLFEPDLMAGPGFAHWALACSVTMGQWGTVPIHVGTKWTALLRYLSSRRARIRYHRIFSFCGKQGRGTSVYPLSKASKRWFHPLSSFHVEKEMGTFLCLSSMTRRKWAPPYYPFLRQAILFPFPQKAGGRHYPATVSLAGMF